jgi:hypothetical protein
VAIEKSMDLIGNRNRDLTACSIVPQPTTLPRTPTPILCILHLFSSRVVYLTSLSETQIIERRMIELEELIMNLKGSGRKQLKAVT